MLETSDLVALAAAHGEQLPRPADRLFESSSFDNFLDFLSWSCSLVRTRDDVHAAAYRYAERARRGGVVAADTIVNPSHWHPWHDNLSPMSASVWLRRAGTRSSASERRALSGGLRRGACRYRTRRGGGRRTVRP